MIHELRISGLGVIAEATCRFAPGFTAVTGETGAGKTMVVSGLGLLAGGRTDAGLVRDGADQAAVEGWFDAPPGSVAAQVGEAGGVVDEDGLTAARLVAARSRSVLGGRGVPTAVLSEVMGQLLVIHGQHDQTRIGARALALLDAYAGPTALELVEEVGQLHAALRNLERELAELRTSEQERARELDLLEFSLAEIADVDPAPDEDIALAAEAERLANADDLVGAALTAREAITADTDREGSDAMGLLSAARRALEAGAAHDPQLVSQAAAISSVMAQLGEVASDLTSYAQDIEVDPLRLATVQDRQAALGRLARKYGPTVTQVLAWSATASQRLAQLAGADDRIIDLEARGADLRARASVLCAAAQRRPQGGCPTLRRRRIGRARGPGDAARPGGVQPDHDAGPRRSRAAPGLRAGRAGRIGQRVGGRRTHGQRTRGRRTHDQRTHGQRGDGPRRVHVRPRRRPGRVPPHGHR